MTSICHSRSRWPSAVVLSSTESLRRTSNPPPSSTGSARFTSTPAGRFAVMNSVIDLPSRASDGEADALTSGGVTSSGIWMTIFFAAEPEPEPAAEPEPTPSACATAHKSAMATSAFIRAPSASRAS